MIEKKPAGDGHAVAVTFVVPRALADGDVTVAGQFNGWDERATPLRSEGVVRTATVVLEAGRTYEFRYCVDGTGSTTRPPTGTRRTSSAATTASST